MKVLCYIYTLEQLVTNVKKVRQICYPFTSRIKVKMCPVHQKKKFKKKIE